MNNILISLISFYALLASLATRITKWDKIQYLSLALAAFSLFFYRTRLRLNNPVCGLDLRLVASHFGWRCWCSFASAGAHLHGAQVSNFEIYQRCIRIYRTSSSFKRNQRRYFPIGIRVNTHSKQSRRVRKRLGVDTHSKR